MWIILYTYFNIINFNIYNSIISTDKRNVSWSGLYESILYKRRNRIICQKNAIHLIYMLHRIYPLGFLFQEIQANIITNVAVYWTPQYKDMGCRTELLTLFIDHRKMRLGLFGMFSVNIHYSTITSIMKDYFYIYLTSFACLSFGCKQLIWNKTSNIQFNCQLWFLSNEFWNTNFIEIKNYIFYSYKRYS